MNCGKFVISALRGGSGKTILSVGIIAALKEKKLSIAPFKKGPDYIDSGWLAHAAGRPCFNLDTFIIPKDQILRSYLRHTAKEDIAVIEGNRGLYDCIDIHGETSTAELAKFLDAPVILVLDCTKTTRTVAAVLSGLMQFDPDVTIGGVVLNRTAGARHEGILRSSIEYHCGLTVLGALPKLKEEIFPERHMGLVPTPEHAWANDAIKKAARIARTHINLDAVIRLAKQHQTVRHTTTTVINSAEKNEKPFPLSSENRPVIGIIKDAAFQFYYPENIEALENEGARIHYISPLSQQDIAPVDALYIGGGFPETHAEQLAQNRSFRSKLKQLAQGGLPVYAECGGLMYLGESLCLNGHTYPMSGVLPVVFGLSKKPLGHGYTIVSVEKENPFFDKGIEFKGHEFHYSKVLEWRGEDKNLVFTMKRGAGFINGKDGVCHQNVLATYTHIHSLGLPVWAKSMVEQALSYQKSNSSHETFSRN